MKSLLSRENCRALLRRLTADKKRAAVLILCLLAVSLLLLSEWTGGDRQPEQTAQPTAEDYAETLEIRLERLLSSVEGAGKTQVLITLRSGTETVYARDDRYESEDGRTQSEQTYVTLRDGTQESGLPLKSVSPQIQGVAIVCEGADDPAVRQALTQTVTAALGVGASHVSVVKAASQKR